MATLTDHLRQLGDHGRLAFHPACPICRDQRLVGALPPDNIVPPRTRALLAAGVLVLSTAGPNVAVAIGQAEEEQGVASPPASGASDSSDDPDFDPGGDSAQLPDAPQPAPRVQAPGATGDDVDTAPLDQEPKSDTAAPIVDAGDGTPDDATAPPAPADDASTQSATTPPPAGDPASAKQAATPVPTSTPATSPTPALTAAATTQAANEVRPRHHRRHATQKPTAHSAITQSSPATPAAAPATSSTPPVAAVPATAPATLAATGGRTARRGDHTHVVRSGESLWSIAADLLGDEATPARIARSVDRMWKLNQAQIGTGNPDLLMPGTKLVLQ